MRQFAAAYQDLAFVQGPLAQISWYHHLTLLTKVKDEGERLFYIAETARNGWSRDIMALIEQVIPFGNAFFTSTSLISWRYISILEVYYITYAYQY